MFFELGFWCKRAHDHSVSNSCRADFMVCFHCINNYYIHKYAVLLLAFETLNSVIQTICPRASKGFPAAGQPVCDLIACHVCHTWLYFRALPKAHLCNLIISPQMSKSHADE